MAAIKLPDPKKVANLPSDPIEGLLRLLDILIETYPLNEGKMYLYDFQVALQYIGAYIAAQPKDVMSSVAVPASGDYFLAFRNKVQQTLRVRMAQSHAAILFRANPDSAVLVAENYKTQVREIILHIRRIIDSADLPAERKADIVSKLNAFSDEVERDISRLDRLGALWLAVTRYAGEGAKNLDPAVKLLERIRKVIGFAQDDAERLLPPPAETMKLPPPEAMN